MINLKRKKEEMIRERSFSLGERCVSMYVLPCKAYRTQIEFENERYGDGLMDGRSDEKKRVQRSIAVEKIRENLLTQNQTIARMCTG